MIPFLIINDISSKTVNGLLIQSLPPISKPKIRTSKEEIDGRDGDIVTPLGFSAYDKTVSIGLKGDYNVDDVISYFNSSGKVIFSNEIDRYYNFNIYDTIDLEKLIRYRVADVKMHVQPFKYDANEVEKTYSYTDVTEATITARNLGNVYSKPTLTITGTGSISVYLNNTQIFSISLNTAQTIIIDVEQMNAYDTEGNYLNRRVVGSYDNFILNTGLNTITINGSITSVSVNKISRWI
jgi:phage-related protein